MLKWEPAGFWNCGTSGVLEVTPSAGLENIFHSSYTLYKKKTQIYLTYCTHLVCRHVVKDGTFFGTVIDVVV